MIPQRTLRNGFAGNELRERVTACRKRLRVNRVAHKSDAGLEFTAGPGAPNPSFLDDEPGMRESTFSSELNVATPNGNSATVEMLPMMETQEVGIT